jgi:hypothetical protein
MATTLAEAIGFWVGAVRIMARFRCTGTHYDGTPCRAIGMPVIRPAELLQVGGPVTLAFLPCSRCVWEINQAQLDKPARTNDGPGCGAADDFVLIVDMDAGVTTWFEITVSGCG